MSHVIGYGRWCDLVHVITEQWLDNSQVTEGVVHGTCMKITARHLLIYIFLHILLLIFWYGLFLD